MKTVGEGKTSWGENNSTFRYVMTSVHKPHKLYSCNIHIHSIGKVKQMFREYGVRVAKKLKRKNQISTAYRGLTIIVTSLTGVSIVHAR